VLASADVLVAILDPDAGEFSVPSKILSYLCSGRPIVLSAPTSNLASRTLRESGAGASVSAEMKEDFVSAVIDMLDDRGQRVRCGRSARAYAEERFDIGSIADQFTEVLSGSSELRTNAWRAGRPRWTGLQVE